MTNPPHAEPEVIEPLSQLRALAQDLSRQSDRLTRAAIAVKSGIAIDDVELKAARAAFGAAGGLFVRTLEAAQTERDTLTARLTAAETAREDAERVDFVQANHYSVMCWDVNGKINNGFTIGSDNGEMDDIAAGTTWRECVDWAMKQHARAATPEEG